MALRTRFGLRLATGGPALGGEDALARLTDMARVAESSGFDALWVPDRPSDVLRDGAVDDAAGHPLEAYTLLGALAMRTSRARLGALVTAAGWRAPSIVAKQVTTLDRLSGGRAVLGLGAGRLPGPLMDRAAGGSGPDPFDGLDDALRICRAMLDEEAATVRGHDGGVSGAANRPRPVQARLPIVVGGNGERRTLPLAVQHADGCNLVGAPETLASKVATIRRLCEEHDRDPADIDVTALVSAVAGAGPAEVERRLARLVPVRGGPQPLLVSGEPATLVAQLAPVLSSGVDGVVLDLAAGADPDVLGELGGTLVDTFGTA